MSELKGLKFLSGLGIRQEGSRKAETVLRLLAPDLLFAYFAFLTVFHFRFLFLVTLSQDCPVDDVANVIRGRKIYSQCSSRY
jgi:hypothetical protein